MRLRRGDCFQKCALISWLGKVFSEYFWITYREKYSRNCDFQQVAYFTIYLFQLTCELLNHIRVHLLSLQKLMIRIEIDLIRIVSYPALLF